MDRAELAAALRQAVAAPSTPAPAGAAAGPELIITADEQTFIRHFTAAVAGNGQVFLGDPAWGESERAAFEALVAAPDTSLAPAGWLMLPSGGTGGKMKLCRHDQFTIKAAVRGFARHFSATRVDAVGVLPLHHVSGLMPWMRCALTGGRFLPWPWKRLEQGDRPPPLQGGSGILRAISLVPTQLQRLLSRDPSSRGSDASLDWLRSFDVVFLGGAAPWPALLEAAAAARLPLSIGFGMTETAAMACGQHPDEFLAGDRSSGRPLPHLRLSITDAGVAALEGQSIFRGYYGTSDATGPERVFVSEDLAQIDAEGRLHVLGRRDAVIITGGKKVDPAEVEAALRATGRFSDLAVIGTPDATWGEQVTLVHPAADGPVTPEHLQAALQGLASYKLPKRVVPITDWPRTAQGKLSRARLKMILDYQKLPGQHH